MQLAALQSGIVLALVNRHLTESEAAHILADSQAQLLIADDRTGAAAAAAAARAGLDAGARFAIDGDSGFTDWRELWGADEPPTDRTAGSLLLYSSGTTGVPKGIRTPSSGRSPEQEDHRLLEGLAAYDVKHDGVASRIVV